MSGAATARRRVRAARVESSSSSALLRSSNAAGSRKQGQARCNSSTLSGDGVSPWSSQRVISWLSPFMITSCRVWSWRSVLPVRRRFPCTTGPGRRWAFPMQGSRGKPKRSGQCPLSRRGCRCSALWRRWSGASAMRRRRHRQPAATGCSLWSRLPSAGRPLRCCRWSAAGCCAARSRAGRFQMSAVAADIPERRVSGSCLWLWICRQCSRGQSRWVCSWCGIRWGWAAEPQAAGVVWVWCGWWSYSRPYSFILR